MKASVIDVVVLEEKQQQGKMLLLFSRCSMVVLFTEIKRDRTTLLRPIALFSRTTGTNCANREQPPRYRC